MNLHRDSSLSSRICGRGVPRALSSLLPWLEVDILGALSLLSTPYSSSIVSSDTVQKNLYGQDATGW